MREEPVWEWTRIRNSAWDLVGVGHLFNMLSRQMLYKPGVGERNLGVIGM